MAITISPRDLELIKSVIGYPKVDSVLLDDSEIIQFAVYPALWEYFRKFPIVERVQYSQGADSESVYPFPDDYTFGVKAARVSDAGIVTGTGTSFWDLVYFQQLSGGSLMGGGQGAYGQTSYNPSNLIQTRDMQRAAYKSYMNTYSTVRYTVDEENKQVLIYSTVVGLLNIAWAKFSDDFSKIKYARKFEVIKLAQANLLNHFADTFSMMSDSALDMTINTEAMKNRAGDLRKEVTDLWDSFPDLSFIHSS